jgi:hypothetical protein
MNEMNDAHAYEMQCNYGSQTPEVLQRPFGFVSYWDKTTSLYMRGAWTIEFPST